MVPPEAGPGLYILKNDVCWPGLIKVGESGKNVGKRAMEVLNSTALPYQGEVVKLFPVASKLVAVTAEAKVHQLLKERRFRADREFFHISGEDDIAEVVELIEDVVQSVTDFIREPEVVAAHHHTQSGGKTIEQLADEAAEILRDIDRLHPHRNRANNCKPRPAELLERYPEMLSPVPRDRWATIIAARRVGLGSDSTLKNALFVVQLARENPALYQPALDLMNNKGEVNPGYILAKSIKARTQSQ